MKTILRNILFIFLLGLLVKCDEDEVTGRNYPRLKTLPVTEITSEGAKFNAEITFRGDFEVINYGFVWGEIENSTLENNDQVVYKENIQSNSFSAVIETNLKEETIYFVRSFIKTSDFLVYGENVNFVSLGSKSPEIQLIDPVKGTVGDTVLIYGSNFSYVKNQNEVLFNDQESVVTHAADTLLKVIVPSDLTELESEISVSIFGNKSASISDFKLTTPTIDQFSPNTGTDYSQVIILGENFAHIKSLNHVRIGSKEAEVTAAEKNQLTAIVPSGILKQENELSVTVGGQQIIANVPFRILSPDITDFQPKQTSIRELVRLEGENFSTVLNGNEVYFDTAQANILELSATSLVVEVPYGVPINSKIKVITAEQEVSTSEDFQIQIPKLQIATPEKATTDKEIILTGNNFSPLEGDNEVLFNGVTANILSNSKTELRVRVPSEINQRSIEVTINSGGHGTTPIAFEYVGGEWSLGPTFPSTNRSSSVMFTLNNKIYVGMGTDNTTGKEHLWVYDISIDSWNQLSEFPGQPRSEAVSLVVNGKVYIGLGTKSARFEGALSDFWEYDPIADTWIQMPDFPGTPRYGVSLFTYQSNAYIGLGEEKHEINGSIVLETYNDFFKFDANAKKWEEVTPFPGTARSYASSFTISDLFYLGLGGIQGTSSRDDDHVVDFWKYNPSMDTWQAISNFPFAGRMFTNSFAIDSKGYIAFGRRKNGSQLSNFDAVIEFDPEDESWTESEVNPNGKGATSLNSSVVIDGVTYMMSISRFNQGTSRTMEIFNPFK